MDAVADGSVALVVTSPPYFAGKQYEEELEREGVPSSYLEYLELLTDVFAECVRKLEPGGRIAVNVANLGRKPYRSLSADVIRILEHDLGLLLRGEIIWQKGEGANGSCAWGSFRSASNPVLRDITERVIVASKGRFDRARPAQAPRRRRPAPREHAAHRRLPRPHARRVVDPARERPAGRSPGAVPGRAARAADPALHLRRRPRARPVHGQRLDARRRGRGSVGATSATTSTPTTSTSPAAGSPSSEPTPAATTGRSTGGPPSASPRRCVDGGRVHRSPAERRRIAGTGVAVDLVLTDATGATWHADVAGPSTTHRGGLLRTDVVWRALGRATALRGRAAGRARPAADDRACRRRAATATPPCGRRPGHRVRRHRPARRRRPRPPRRLRRRGPRPRPLPGFW